MSSSDKSLLTRLAVIAVVLSVVTACNTSFAPGATQPPQVAVTRLAGEVSGELVVVDGCLRVNTDHSSTSYLLVWPPGFTVDVDGDVVQVADTIMGEAVVWRVGEGVWLGGGTISDIAWTDLSAPANCPGPFWIAGGLEIPATFSNLVLLFGFKRIEVEVTGDATDDGFSIMGKSILAGGERVSVYEFINEDAAKTEVEFVSEDGLTITRVQGDELIETDLSWLETPRFFQKDRVIVIYAGDDSKIKSALQALLGPQFAGGH